MSSGCKFIMYSTTMLYYWDIGSNSTAQHISRQRFGPDKRYVYMYYQDFGPAIIHICINYWNQKSSIVISPFHWSFNHRILIYEYMIGHQTLFIGYRTAISIVSSFLETRNVQIILDQQMIGRKVSFICNDLEI